MVPDVSRRPQADWRPERWDFSLYDHLQSGVGPTLHFGSAWGGLVSEALRRLLDYIDPTLGAMRRVDVNSVTDVSGEENVHVFSQTEALGKGGEVVPNP
jgi:hypothetical protein